ncbi:hypothetical protein [Candidatus Lokiarchaeum ossiferum]|uniref:hypothetical protein n=1 Tax=Candidatus Lokiarchaeum ossiferum TaxID=2951803 RepID=UPI00352E9F35
MVITDPKILSKEEIETLNAPKSSKLKLRWVFLSIGIILFILAILFYVFAWNIAFLAVDITYNRETFSINLSILFASVLLTASLLVISQVWMNTSNYSENSLHLGRFSENIETPLYNGKVDRKMEEVDQIQFRHFVTSRFIAAVIILLLAAINMSVFGTAIDDENHLGSWFFLGGPSMFFPMSAFMFLIALGLLGYTLFSTAIFTFTKTKHFYLIEERRIFIPLMTEIPRENIQGIRITNAKTGPKYFWIILAAFNLILCFTDGLYFLTNEFAFGSGLIVGKFYILTGIGHLIAIGILVFKHQNMLEIVTNDKIYELYFSTPAAPMIKDGILALFNLRPPINSTSMLQKTFLRDGRNLVTGLFFLLCAILSAALYRGAGVPVRIPLYIFGAILVVRGIKEDFTSKNGFQIEKNGEKQTLYLQKRFGWLQSNYKFSNFASKSLQIEYQMKKLNTFDVLMGISFGFVLGLNLCSFFYNVPSNSLASGMKVFQIIGSIILFFIVIAMMIMPTNSLIIENKFLLYSYPIPGILSEAQQKVMEGKNFFQRLFLRWKNVYIYHSEGFWYRIALVVMSFFFGMIFYGQYVASFGIWFVPLILLIVLIGYFITREIVQRRKQNPSIQKLQEN